MSDGAHTQGRRGTEREPAAPLPPLGDLALSGRLRPEDVFDAFVDHVAGSGFELYPAQEEAILEIMEGASVILNTPTGSGKSLVATAMNFKALSEGRRSFYTAPIKALVSEKFFALCHLFGAQNVGMMTGDAAINPLAPIVCCTAEVLSQMALRLGPGAGLDYVIVDEFHYYSDKDRGTAWQMPLLALTDATFLLMSATLGDITEIQKSLEARTGRRVALVQSSQRPVPLEFAYRETYVHETVADLLGRGRAPIYVVSFTQREATELAQDLTSSPIVSREARERIRSELAGFRFDSPFGGTFRRFVSAGIGVHHAGLLPKYRLLAERLAQAGLLQVISGTDTLGVGINVPIRTVVFTKLCKFDGDNVAILSVRDFKQIAGRAGRKGYDDQGWVVCQAPGHVVENRRAEAKAAGSGKKIKVHKVQPPTKGYVPWDQKTFERLIHGQPEALRSRFKVDHGMLLNVLQRPGGNGYRELIGLIDACHETPGGKKRLRRHLRTLFVSLRDAGIVDIAIDEETGRRHARANLGLQSDFSLHQSLSLFLVNSLERIEALALPPEEYALAVLSFVEAMQESPLQILNAQTNRLKREALQAMKAAGMEYEERIEELEKVSYEKPLAELIYDLFNRFAEKNPWVSRENVYPKSIAREMFERYMSFGEYVRHYGLETVEGVLLRYISSCYKVLARTVPIAYLNDTLVDVIGYFRAMLERVDSSLLREWEDLLAPPAEEESAPDRPEKPRDISRDPRAFAARIRAEAHALVKALSMRDFEEAAQCVFVDPFDAWTPARLEQAVAPWFARHGEIRADHAARLAEHTQVRPVAPRVWEVTQSLLDADGERDGWIEALVDLHEQVPTDGPVLRIRAFHL